MEETRNLKCDFTEFTLFDEIDSEIFLETMKQESIENGLFGDYNADGDYKINEEIIKDLVTCEKSIVEETKNEYNLEAQIGEFLIKFELKIETQDRQKNATLTLVENVKSPNKEFAREIKTYLASYFDYDDDNYITKVKSVFHIHSKQGDKLDYDKEKNGQIARARKQKQAMLLKGIMTEEDENREYIKKLIKLLSNSGSKGDFILKKYKRLLANLPNKEDKLYYFKLKQLLHQAMITSGVQLEPVQKQIIKNLFDEQHYQEEILFKKVLTPKIVTKKKEVIIAKQEEKKKAKKEEKKEDGKGKKNDKPDKTDKNNDSKKESPKDATLETPTKAEVKPNGLYSTKIDYEHARRSAKSNMVDSVSILFGDNKTVESDKTIVSSVHESIINSSVDIKIDEVYPLPKDEYEFTHTIK